MSLLLSLLFAAAMQTPAPNPAQVVARDMMSMVDEPKQVVARTAPEWAALWRQHAGDKPLPAVDLSKHTVVAVFLGSRSSAGFSVDVTAVRPAAGGVVVEWQERRPSGGDVQAQLLTSPAVIVTIPKTAGTITFEKAAR